jgi:transcriptional regulator with XRE-family HTH domain
MTKGDERLSVGDRIARARDAYRLSQAQLGAHLRVTRAAVSQYEKDQIKPRPGVFEKLGQLFDADPAWFEQGRGRPPAPPDTPVTIPEINVAALHERTLDPRELSNGREWRLPATVFPNTESFNHIVAILAPNDAHPICRGDHVLIDTRRRQGAGVFLVVDPAKGPQLCCGDAAEAWIVGRAITYLRVL